MKRANEDDQEEVKEEVTKENEAEIKQEIEKELASLTEPQNAENLDPGKMLENEMVKNVENPCENEVKMEVKDNLPVCNPPKRRRKNEEDMEFRFLISTKTAGAIIGKNGHNIQKLRSDHEAKINIIDCKGPERVLTIISSLDVCYNVIRDILKYFEPSKPNEFDLRFLVHQSLAGCIIGRSGSKIKELKSKLGCHIKVFPNVAPQSFERVVQMIGNEDQCINSFTEIMSLIRSNNLRGAVRYYDPHNFDDLYANEYGGYGIVNPSRNVPYQRQFNDRKVNDNINNGRGKFNNDRRGDNRKGPKNQNNFNNNNNNNNYVDPWASQTPINQMQQLNNNFGTNNLTEFGFNKYTHQPELTSTQVTIPINLAGACIGKGGSRIRNIRDESQAAIKIDQPLPGSTDRIITITGTPKQIQAAQYLLQRSVQNIMN